MYDGQVRGQARLPLFGAVPTVIVFLLWVLETGQAAEAALKRHDSLGVGFRWDRDWWVSFNLVTFIVTSLAMVCATVLQQPASG